ncbi:MAG: hypothetical protein V1660_03170 [archaeon]
MVNEEIKKDFNQSEKRHVCEKCQDTGKILTKEGMRTCFDCLVAGRLDVHSKEVKDTNIKW